MGKDGDREKYKKTKTHSSYVGFDIRPRLALQEIHARDEQQRVDRGTERLVEEELDDCVSDVQLGLLLGL